MSDIKPVMMLSQQWDSSAGTGVDRIRRIIIEDGSLILSDPTTTGWTPRVLQLPPRPFTMSGTGGAEHESWVAVLNWIEASFDETAHLVMDYDHPLRELILFGSAAFGLRYNLRFDTALRRFVSPLDYAIIGNAEAVLFAEPALHEEFRRNYMGPYRAITSFDELGEASDASKRIRSSNDSRSTSAESPKTRSADGVEPIRTLIVAYFSGPCRSVGVQRPNYWLDELARISEGAIDVQLVTATNWGEPREDVLVVPDYHAASLLDKNGNYPSWAAQFVAEEQRQAIDFNTLSYYWAYELERFFRASAHHYDVVVISGNPFSCFDFAAFAKRHWNARVVLDYRDPFANNPRFLYSSSARMAARYAERGFNLQADAVSVVNDYCAGLVEGAADTDVIIVPNGFDERVVNTVQPQPLVSDKVNLVHSGSFYHYGSPADLLAALDPARHIFHHIGSTSGIDSSLLEHESMVTHGRRPYSDTLALVGGADIGVVFLSEHNFETTTKLFDYFAMGIDVLLCTKGEPGTGALAEILEGQEGVYWCKNTEEAISRFLRDYQPGQGHVRPAPDLFSRRHGSERLAAKIVELAGS